MTEWIEKMAARVNEQQRAANRQDEAKVREEQSIKLHAPEYFNALRQAAEQLTTELRQRLGISLWVILRLRVSRHISPLPSSAAALGHLFR